LQTEPSNLVYVQVPFVVDERSSQYESLVLRNGNQDAYGETSLSSGHDCEDCTGGYLFFCDHAKF